MQQDAVDRDQAQKLARLRWIFLQGTYVFGTADPSLKGEQRRWVELCVIAGGALFPWIVDPEGILDDPDGQAAWNEVFGPYRFWWDGEPKLTEEAIALMENWLGWKSSWDRADSPIAWVRGVAKIVHQKTCPLAMDKTPNIRSLDATTDPYAALIPDLQAISPAEIHATLDVELSCEREGLAHETALLARVRYDQVSYRNAAELLGLSNRNIAAAARELRSAMPALQARLAPYREKRKTK